MSTWNIRESRPYFLFFFFFVLFLLLLDMIGRVFIRSGCWPRYSYPIRPATTATVVVFDGILFVSPFFFVLFLNWKPNGIIVAARKQNTKQNMTEIEGFWWCVKTFHEFHDSCVCVSSIPHHFPLLFYSHNIMQSNWNEKSIYVLRFLFGIFSPKFNASLACFLFCFVYWWLDSNVTRIFVFFFSPLFSSMEQLDNESIPV